jgi:hypothetical protein
MLGTIKMPMNMKLIQEKLPSSNYESDKPKKAKKEEIVIESPMLPIAEEEPEDNNQRNAQNSAMSRGNPKKAHRHPKVLKSLNQR